MKIGGGTHAQLATTEARKTTEHLLITNGL